MCSGLRWDAQWVVIGIDTADGKEDLQQREILFSEIMRFVRLGLGMLAQFREKLL
jgi:hypothetical protein